MKRNQTPSFVLTKPLHCEPWQRERLDTAFFVANILYNNLTADRNRALVQLERSRAWRTNQAAIKAAYTDKTLAETARRDILKPLFQEKANLLAKAGMSEYAFQARIQRYRKRYSSVIGTHVAQKIASAVWSKFKYYLFDTGKEVRFRRLANWSIPPAKAPWVWTLVHKRSLSSVIPTSGYTCSPRVLKTLRTSCVV